jgi:hypothetical protein
MDDLVQTRAFDEECVALSKEINKCSLADGHGSDSDRVSLRENNNPSSVSSIESSRYEVSKLEAHLYYFGLRGHRRRGPKLIFRTSKDVFKAPTGPEQDPRLMRLLPV